MEKIFLPYDEFNNHWTLDITFLETVEKEAKEKFLFCFQHVRDDTPKIEHNIYYEFGRKRPLLIKGITRNKFFCFAFTYKMCGEKHVFFSDIWCTASREFILFNVYYNGYINPFIEENKESLKLSVIDNFENYMRHGPINRIC